MTTNKTTTIPLAPPYSLEREKLFDAGRNRAYGRWDKLVAYQGWPKLAARDVVLKMRKEGLLPKLTKEGRQAVMTFIGHGRPPLRDVRASKRLNIRVTEYQRQCYHDAAKAAGFETTSEWFVHILDRAAKTKTKP